MNWASNQQSWKRKRFRFCSNTSKAVISKKLQDTINFYCRLLWYYCIMPQIITMCNRTYTNLISFSHLLLLVLYIILRGVNVKTLPLTTRRWCVRGQKPRRSNPGGSRLLLVIYSPDSPVIKNTVGIYEALKKGFYMYILLLW